MALALLLPLPWAHSWRATTTAHAAAPLPPNSFTPAISEAIQKIDTESLTRYVGDLSGEWPIEVAGETVTLSTRYSFADASMDLAEAYALERFAELGLAATCHSYILESQPRCNIVAIQPGALVPETVIVVGAHLDSITDSRAERLTIAPGADDNASGVAAVLATASALYGYEFSYNIHYVLFTGEEQGHYGSAAYARHLAAKGYRDVMMVNLDMIGYNSTNTPSDIDIHIRAGAAGRGDWAIGDIFSRAITTYNLGLIPEIVPSGTTASDHDPFWQLGYPAVLVIEDFEDFNPHYHTAQDLLTHLDADYLTRATQAVVATVAQLAGIVDFVAKPGTISTGEPVTLWAISHLPGTLPVNYSWDLGNGVPLIGPILTSTFSSQRYPTLWGLWTITMTVGYEGKTLKTSRELAVGTWEWGMELPRAHHPY